MINPNSIFLWEGKIQLGDEPGIYGDASFSGIGIKLPFTISNILPASPQEDAVTFTIKTGDVNVCTGYPGHKIVVYGYTKDPAVQYHWIETVLKDTDRITSGGDTLFEVPVKSFQDNAYIAIGIDVDTSVQPGLYDDFLLLGISYAAKNGAVYMKFGFQ